MINELNTLKDVNEAYELICQLYQDLKKADFLRRLELRCRIGDYTLLAFFKIRIQGINNRALD